MKISAIFCSSVVSLSVALALPSKDLNKRSSVKGFDVSGYQPNVNFGSAYSGGLRFVLIKATESTDYISPTVSICSIRGNELPTSNALHPPVQTL